MGIANGPILASNPLSAILNCADLCTANHETIASILDQLSLQVHDEDGQRLIEEVRVEVSLLYSSESPG